MHGVGRLDTHLLSIIIFSFDWFRYWSNRVRRKRAVHCHVHALIKSLPPSMIRPPYKSLGYRSPPNNAG